MGVVEVLTAAGCADVSEVSGVVSATWRGMPVRLDARADVAAVERAFDATRHLPDPIAVAEIDLTAQRVSGASATFVPVVDETEGHALRTLSGDSFLVILDRVSGDMVVLGQDASRHPIELHHNLPRASVDHEHGLPGRAAFARLNPGSNNAPPVDRHSKLARLLPHLRCVRCDDRDHAPRLEGDTLICASCGTTYPVVDGTPIMLVDETADFEPGPEPVSSNSYTRQSLAFFELYAKGLVLDCGSGSPTDQMPQVVSLERVRYPNVDIVASCDRIPFAEGVFDAAICESVLEHVPDPQQVADELHRVLMDRGPVRIDAPFVAPFHAYPNHFCNFTQSGLDNLLRGFDKTDGGIGPHQEPWLALAWMLRLAREGLSDDARREQFDAARLGEILESVSAGQAPEVLHPLDDSTRRAIAAGFYFVGNKRSGGAG